MVITDEMLMAYVDGELSKDDCRRLEAMLTQDGGLRARLEPFAMTGTPLANVFDRPLHEPIPDRLLAVITSASRGRPVAAARRTNVRSGGIFGAIADAIFPFQGGGLQLAGAFSLGALFAAGGAAGYIVSQTASSTPGGDVVAFQGGDLVATGNLRVALETKPSLDDERARESGATLWPAQSFKGRNQRFCREYRIAPVTGGDAFAGIACRSADAQWHVAVHAGLKSGGSGEFKLLDHPESPAVEAAFDNMKEKGGIAFGPDEEAAALASGWHAPSN